MWNFRLFMPFGKKQQEGGIPEPRVRIGINGFGHVGRMALRAALTRADVEVVAISAPGITAAQVANAFKYDTVHGRFSGTVSYTAEALIVNRKPIKLLNGLEPAFPSWYELKADCVLETTGEALTAEEVQIHIDAGAKMVILCAIPTDDMPVFVMGVNQEKYTPDIRILSAATSEIACMAPLAKVICENFGIADGVVTTMQATADSLRVVDGYDASDLRLARSCFENMIPVKTKAAECVGRVLPLLADKLSGMAMRVPCAGVSAMDLTCRLERPVSYEGICAAVKAAAGGSMAGQIYYCDDEVVSQDLRMTPQACVFDAGAGFVQGDGLVKLIAWYDNDWGYANNLLELCKHVHGK